jgi:phosphoribosylformimino-5-aminoimidazole carboxamide ribotide isomerase
MTRFRPCIDLHKGQVKQIVGGTLTNAEADLKTNFVSSLTASHYASIYRDSDLVGAHVIMLGPGSEEAARQALAIWPNKLQIGGGINDQNARQWIEAGAEKVSTWTSNMILVGHDVGGRLTLTKDLVGHHHLVPISSSGFLA